MGCLDNSSRVIDKLKENSSPKIADTNVPPRTEVIRDSPLLIDAEQTLSEIEKEVEAVVARHDARISEVERLCAALAPSERLPSELLSAIFLLLSEDVDVLIPPKLTQLPWILGRVCSHWRYISRSEPQLWGCPQVTLRSQSAQDLEYALEILPSTVNVSIRVYVINFDLKSLTPYLNRCNSLEIGGNINSFDDFWSAVPREGFIDLHKFSIFVSDSLLHERRLDLKANWAFTSESLYMATQLQSVKLRAGVKWSQTLMTIGLPWNQLTCLDIDVSSTASTLCTLCKVLQQCDSLRELYVTTDHSSISAESINDISLPNLWKLNLSGYNSRFIPPLRTWEHLTHLSLRGTYPADDLQHILQKCVKLTDLSLNLPPDFPLEPLSLPFLRSMLIANSLTEMPPLSHFVLPELEHLSILDRGPLDRDPLNLASVSRMLENSQSSLCNLYYNGYGSDPPSLRDLLESISTLPASSPISVLFPRTRFPIHILYDIGLGTLLPKLERLVCEPESVEAMLDMLEARVDREVQLWRGGSTTLTIRTSQRMSEMQAERLKNLHYRVPQQINVKIASELDMESTGDWQIMFENPAE